MTSHILSRTEREARHFNGMCGGDCPECWRQQEREAQQRNWEEAQNEQPEPPCVNIVARGDGCVCNIATDDEIFEAMCRECPFCSSQDRGPSPEER